MANAYGAMIDSVCMSRGTSGNSSVGRLDGSSPSSPTLGTSNAKTTVAVVSRTIATSGAGTAFVSFGRNTSIRSATARSG